MQLKIWQQLNITEVRGGLRILVLGIILDEKVASVKLRTDVKWVKTFLKCNIVINERTECKGMTDVLRVTNVQGSLAFLPGYIVG